MNTWTRSELKARAKEVLKVNYWIALVVSLILGIVTGGGSGSSSNGQSRYSNNSDYSFRETFDQLDAESIQAIMIGASIIIGIIIVVIIISLLFKLFLGYQLQVGCEKFFVTSAEQPHKSMRPLGYCFTKGKYFPTMFSMLLKDVYLFLWCLLAILGSVAASVMVSRGNFIGLPLFLLMIPLIIKSYAYLMVPYILADNPEIGAKKAIHLSSEMMSGEKWRTFVLGLSFLNWFIPGIALFVIAVFSSTAIVAGPIFIIAAIITVITAFFIAPYINSTFAQLYLVLRDKAINKNLATLEELNLK